MRQITLKPIAQILRSGNLEVPAFQRPYAWTLDQVEQLMADVESNLGKEDYFIGTLFTSVENRSKNLIIDGQQRLATVSIMLAAARDRLVDLEDSESANQLQQFLLDMKIATKERTPKLKMSEQDGAFFRTQFIYKDQKIPIKYSSHKRLDGAYKTVSESISKMSDNDLRVWAEFIQERLMVIHIETSQESDAYAMFETINDRGVQLAQIDLIKTHLLKKSNESPEVKKGWSEIIDKMVDARDEEEMVLLFLRHNWSSIYGLTREKERGLYKAIEDKIQNPSAVSQQINKWQLDVSYYSQIIRPVPNFWRKYSNNNDAYNNIITLESFGIDRYRPLLLSAMRRWSDDDPKSVYLLLRFLVTWLIRNLIGGGLGSGTLEKAYCTHAVKIEKSNTKDFAQFHKEIQKHANLVPSDNLFKQKLKTATLTKPNLARYFLATIENALREISHPELIVNRDPNHVNLEHIMPKKAENPDWDAFSEEEKVEYLQRIGNLTLLSAPLNRSLRNGPYKDKKKDYAKSELRITKNIPSDYPEWNKSSVERRQEELANTAVKTWSIDL